MKGEAMIILTETSNLPLPRSVNRHKYRCKYRGRHKYRCKYGYRHKYRCKYRCRHKYRCKYNTDTNTENPHLANASDISLPTASFPWIFPDNRTIGFRLSLKYILDEDLWANYFWSTTFGDIFKVLCHWHQGGLARSFLLSISIDCEEETRLKLNWLKLYLFIMIYFFFLI